MKTKGLFILISLVTILTTACSGASSSKFFNRHIEDYQSVENNAPLQIPETLQTRKIKDHYALPTQLGVKNHDSQLLLPPGSMVLQHKTGMLSQTTDQTVEQG